TLRWQLILRDVGGQRLPLLPLWHATAIGFMANNLLPVRAGEFARAYAAQQQLPVRFSTALASVGVERVLDGLLLVGLMMLAIASPAFPGHARGRVVAAGYHRVRGRAPGLPRVRRRLRSGHARHARHLRHRCDSSGELRVGVPREHVPADHAARSVLVVAPADPPRRAARGGRDRSLTWRSTGYASRRTRSSTCCCVSWRAKHPQDITRSRPPSRCSSWQTSSSSPARAPASRSRCTAPIWAPRRPISRCAPPAPCWKRAPPRSVGRSS